MCTIFSPVTARNHLTCVNAKLCCKILTSLDTSLNIITCLPSKRITVALNNQNKTNKAVSNRELYRPLIFFVIIWLLWEQPKNVQEARLHLLSRLNILNLSATYRPERFELTTQRDHLCSDSCNLTSSGKKQTTKKEKTHNGRIENKTLPNDQFPDYSLFSSLDKVNMLDMYFQTIPFLLQQNTQWLHLNKSKMCSGFPHYCDAASSLQDVSLSTFLVTLHNWLGRESRSCQTDQ